MNTIVQQATSIGVLGDSAGVLAGQAVVRRYNQPNSELVPDMYEALGAYAGVLGYAALVAPRYAAAAGSSPSAELALKAAAVVAGQELVARAVGDGAGPMSARRLILGVLGAAGGLYAAGMVTPMVAAEVRAL